MEGKEGRRTTRAKGSFGMRFSVVCWKRRISRRATVPGRKRRFFAGVPAGGIAARTATGDATFFFWMIRAGWGEGLGLDGDEGVAGMELRRLPLFGVWRGIFSPSPANLRKFGRLFRADGEGECRGAKGRKSRGGRTNGRATGLAKAASRPLSPLRRSAPFTLNFIFLSHHSATDLAHGSDGAQHEQLRPGHGRPPGHRLHRVHDAVCQKCTSLSCFTARGRRDPFSSNDAPPARPALALSLRLLLRFLLKYCILLRILLRKCSPGGGLFLDSLLRAKSLSLDRQEKAREVKRSRRTTNCEEDEAALR